MIGHVSKAFFHTLAGSHTLKHLASRYGMRSPRSFARRFIAGESIEYLEVRLGIEKRLLLALTVNVDEIRSQIAQQRLRGELVIDENLVASG